MLGSVIIQDNVKAKLGSMTDVGQHFQSIASYWRRSEKAMVRFMDESFDKGANDPLKND